MTSRSSRDRKIATRLSSHLHGFLSGGLDDQALAVRLRKLAGDIEKGMPKAAVNDETNQGIIDRVFHHWLRRMSKPNQTKLTDGRRRVICARLKEGYTEDQILGAIDACSADKFYMGDNDRKTSYNDLTQILRSGEKVEQFLEQRSEQEPTHDLDPEVQRLQEEATEALDMGDTNAYNAANAQLGAIQNTRG